MNKKFLKLMTAAAAVVAVVGCTDDLGLEQQSMKLQQGDMKVTIENRFEKSTRMAMQEVAGANPWDSGSDAGWGWVFVKDDQVRCYTAEAMDYEVYNLTGGENTNQGLFTRVKGFTRIQPDGKNRWAVTDAQFVYSVSPDFDGNAWLTYTIPYKYATDSEIPKDDDNEEIPNVDIRKFPAPFWGYATVEDTEAEDADLHVGIKALTSFLRIEMKELPDDAQYIVLTTHGYASVEEEVDGAKVDYDGFQIVQPLSNTSYTTVEGCGKKPAQVKIKGEAVNFSDTYAWWEQNVDTITDATSEPLSGTFTTALKVSEDNKRTSKDWRQNTKGNSDDEYPVLHVDEGLADGTLYGGDYDMDGISRLVTKDEIVIDVTKYKTKNTDGVFYVPIITQHYNNLYVLAVTYMNPKKPYKYVGTILGNFYDTWPARGQVLKLNTNMMNLGTVCAHDLNYAIWKINQANKYKISSTNVLNVDTLIECPEEIGNSIAETPSPKHFYKVDDKVYHNGNLRVNEEQWERPNDQILVQGEGQLVININNIQAQPKDQNAYSAVRSDLKDKTKDIEDNGSSHVLFVSDVDNHAKGQKIRSSWQGISTDNSVLINLPKDWSEESDVKVLLSDLPTYNVIIAANDAYEPAEQPGAKYLDVFAYGSATNFTSGHDAKFDTEIKNETAAAIKVISGIRTLYVMDDTKGDVYVQPATGEKVEINQGIDIRTKNGIDVRLDNAMAKEVLWQKSSNNNENLFITTGSSAVQRIGVRDNKFGYEETTLDNMDDNADKPNDVTLLSFWTGYALDKQALNVKDYDNGRIYTVAQLASMGEEIGYVDPTATETADVDKSTTAEYKISNLVRNMWLGGKLYGWVGPKVTIKDFVFDGNSRSLLNMYMPNLVGTAGDTYDQPVYAADPHICCTTCGFKQNALYYNPGAAGTDAEVLESWGLIRSIVNGGDATIINVNLNDVRADQDVTNNIGSLIGLVNITGNLSFDYDRVGEVNINVPKKLYIGGMVGSLNNAADVTVKMSQVGNSYGNTGYVKGKQYVGGMFGRLGTNDVNNLTVEDSKVSLKEVTATEDRVGGIAGWAKLTENTDMDAVSVTVKDLISAKEYSGGLYGELEAKKNTWDEVAVVAGDIKATNGNYAAGQVAYLTATSIEGTDNSVVADNIYAKGQFAAGLIGYDDAATVNLTDNDVTVKTIEAGDGYVGGFVAYAHQGEVTVGTHPNLDSDYRDFVNNVTVTEALKGAYNVGGLVGYVANTAEVWVKTGNNKGVNRPEENVKSHSYVNVDVKSFANTKGEGTDALKSYYNPEGTEGMADKVGTFSNLVGQLKGLLIVNEKYMTVKDYLQSEMKEKVGYKVRVDQSATDGTIRKYWGDNNGYVGYGNAGNFYLTNDVSSADNYVLTDMHNQVTGDQIMIEDGFNLYKTEADYATTSKNAVE